MISLIKRHKVIFTIITLIVLIILYILLITPTDRLLRNQITKLTQIEANDISQCKVIPMGRMGCGGPGKYIIYSTKDTNVFLLKTLISTRNIITFPIESLSISICSITPKPSSVFSEGKCKAEYETYSVPGLVF